MSIPDLDIEEFQRIWKREYGKDITKEEAQTYAERLVNFFRIFMEVDRFSKNKD